MPLRHIRLNGLLIMVATLVAACGGSGGSSSSASSSSSSSSTSSASSSSSVSSVSSSSSSSSSSVSSSSSSSSASSISLPTYHITEFVPVTSYSATPVDINENNVVVGTARNGSANPASIGFYWTLSGGAVMDGSLALAVTSNDEVVIQNADASGNVTLTMLDPALGSATGIYQTGISNSYPFAYSRTGAAVGGSSYWSGPTTTTSMLASLAGASSVTAQSINAAGQIVGYANTSSGIVPIYWADHTATPVAMQGTIGNPIAISSDGKIIGIKQPGGGVTMMYYWSSPAATPVLISVANLTPIPIRINKDGIFVGYATSNSGSYAMVGTAATGPVDLATRLDSSGAGWTLYYAEAINDNGVIVGSGIGPDGRTAAFIAVPN